METKTYQVKSMQEAIEQVRAELGDSACILHSRRIRSKLDQLVGRQGILEVVAARDADIQSRFPVEMSSAPQLDTFDIEAEARHHAASAKPATRQETGGPSFADDVNRNNDSASDRHSGRCFDQAPRATSASIFELAEHLRRAGFTHDDCLMLGADERADAAANSTTENATLSAWTSCCERLCQSLQTIGPLEVPAERQAAATPHVVAFVGPTGVGKTTTLAKLAAHYYLQQQLRVGFITVDTYRIAAVEQLRTYARIIDAPLEVVATAAEMRQACERLADLDLVLIDTGGNSPKDDHRLGELAEILPAAKAEEIVLVMSSVCSASAFRRAVDAYGRLGVSSLVLTKLDEADGFGQLWRPLLESHLPLRYVTDGQDVPRDIAIAHSPALTWEMLGGLPAELEACVPQEDRHA